MHAQTYASKTRRIVYSCFAIVLLSITSASAHAIADFALGGHNICAIDVDGRLECTTRFNPNTYLPHDDGTLYTAVDSGGAHSCAITQSCEIRCWGLNNLGQSNNVPTSPVAFTELSAGENHTCAIDANGQVYCWGLNTNGQTDVSADNQGFVSLYTGAIGSCGIRTSGIAECWSTESSYTLTLIADQIWSDLVFPSEGNVAPPCGLNSEGAIECWTTHGSLPTPANGPYTNIESSGVFFCGLTTSGDVDCSVLRFQAGSSANATNQTILAAIETLPPLVDFEVRSNGPSLHGLCGIDFDGELHCVGNGLPTANLPGQQIDVPVPSNLSFTIYSDYAGELFWQSDISALRSPVSGYKVYRNDELLRFSAASASYFEDDLQPDSTYEYQVSIVLLDGTEGKKSESVSVSTGDLEPTPGNSANAPDYLLLDMELIRYSGLTLELFYSPAEQCAVDVIDQPDCAKRRSGGWISGPLLMLDVPNQNGLIARSDGSQITLESTIYAAAGYAWTQRR